MARNLRRKAAVVLEASGNISQIVFGFHNRFARVAAFEFGQGRQVLAHLLRHAE